ncbi:MAG: hypothetical protein Q8O84_05280 [Nanoarchaeota archaeon]|nr:hypothetical protein [Nanoarchaeota archaeon]
MKYDVPSPNTIRKSFQKSKYSFIEYHIHRRISPFFTWFFLHFTLTAELIALLTPLNDLVTLYLISNGDFILAAILTQMHIILDSSDGEVARFRKTIVKRSKNQDSFGGFADSMVGMILFPFIIFYAGFIFGNLITGLISIGAFYLMVFSSAYAKVYFPKSEIGAKLREKAFGKRKYKWGFNSIIQKSLITLALLFQSVVFLWIFVAGALVVSVLRVYLLYKQK